MDPRRVIEVLRLAADLLADGASHRGILGEAVRWLGLAPTLDSDDEPTEGYALWQAALDAEIVDRPGGTYPQAPEEGIERRVALLAAADRLRRETLAMSLFCGALAGWLDARLVGLVTGDDAARAVALDLAEERGLDRPEGWAPWRREVAWPEAGEHEHVWLAWESGEERRAMQIAAAFNYAEPVRRCTCGVFEHESPRRGRCCAHPVERHAYNGCADCGCAVRWADHPDRDLDTSPEARALLDVHRDAPGPLAGDACHDPRCDMPRGHVGNHCRRWYILEDHEIALAGPEAGADPDAAPDPSVYRGVVGY